MAAGSEWTRVRSPAGGEGKGARAFQSGALKAKGLPNQLGTPPRLYGLTAHLDGDWCLMWCLVCVTHCCMSAIGGSGAGSRGVSGKDRKVAWDG